MTAPEELYGHVALQIDQVTNLARVLQTVIEMEKQEPLEGDQVGALATALLRAGEDAISSFEAHYHPSAEASL